MTPIVIELAGEPKGKGRPRHTRAGLTYTPARTRSQEAALGWAAAAAMQGRKPLEGALRVSIETFVSVPTSWSKKKQRMALAGEIVPTTKPDADNVAKLAADACNTIVWRDDSQIADMRITKRYSERPRLLITVASVIEAHEIERVAA
jgi:Holliday junction resolvase RusA-like endonuclease